ncbi:gamma-glutamylcyclotransferase family protein [Deinococcus multiflagellatus]|uniref:Gamma-glutamylcyclotransferase family protein n=1 Tax=Deinococcus multiflagellatus TaxID=1656887 RepID=A0ABW1ZLB0_9DEIO
MTQGPCGVFVYGTLMPGERNAHVAALGGPFRAQRAVLRGFALYHLSPEAYPALVPGPPDAEVSGQLLSYTPEAWRAALPFLDDLEGLHDTPPLYTRQPVTLHLEGGERRPPGCTCTPARGGWGSPVPWRSRAATGGPCPTATAQPPASGKAPAPQASKNRHPASGVAVTIQSAFSGRCAGRDES